MQRRHETQVAALCRDGLRGAAVNGTNAYVALVFEAGSNQRPCKNDLLVFNAREAGRVIEVSAGIGSFSGITGVVIADAGGVLFKQLESGGETREGEAHQAKGE